MILITYPHNLPKGVHSDHIMKTLTEDCLFLMDEAQNDSAGEISLVVVDKPIALEVNY